MPKRDKKFRKPFNLNEWGRQKMREKNAAAEESARFTIALDAAEAREDALLDLPDLEEEMLAREEDLRKLKTMKGSKKKLVFVTLNYNEKLVTPTGTVPYVKRILDHAKVTQGFAYWEWRDPVAETGLHTHIVLQGDTRRIVEHLKRSQGPYTELKVDKPKDYPKLNTVKKYPLSYWSEKLKYANETFSESKNEIKKHYENLRIKYELPNIFK